MKTIGHQIFLKNNKLEKKVLLEAVQEKIAIFDRMYKMLDSVSDCQEKNLLQQLEELDLEILEDIDNEYADKLNYNDIKEVLEAEPEPEKIKELIKEKPKKVTDESIIEQLVKIGSTNNIGRSTFRDLGLKTQLGWSTTIGKYVIKRISVFSYRYSILER